MSSISIVTGASAGMGAEFVRQIAQLGISDEIWIIARRTERLKALTAEVMAQSRCIVRPFSMDITGTEGIDRFSKLLKSQEEEAGTPLHIRMLVNNAGFGTYGTFLQTNLHRQLEMIELNCVSLTGICGIAIPYMDRTSILINVASLAAVMPLGNFAVYAATKAYVRSFTLALAAETADMGIKVCALCPGSVSTEFADIASNGARKTVLHGKSPEKVVAHCLRKARAGKHIAIMAPKWKFNALISRFVSHYFGARMTYKYAKRPSNPTT